MNDHGSDLDRAKAVFFQGLDHMDGGNLKAAEDSFRATLAIVPQHGPSLNNLAVVLRGQNRIEESAAAAEAALAADDTSIEARVVLAECRREQARYAESLDILRDITARDPLNAEAFTNQSFLLNRIRRYDEAAAAAGRALEIDPRNLDARVNRANALVNLGLSQDALGAYDDILAASPRFIAALVGRAEVLFQLKRYPEAILAYNAILAVSPDYEFARGYLFEVRNRICDWRGHEEMTADVAARVERGEKVLFPFTALSGFDSLDLQLKVARLFADTKFPPTRIFPDIGRYAAHDRIRIGYFSADFRNHAVAFLIAELIEQHDRSKFEVIGFSFGPDDADAMRERLGRSFDRFIDVSRLSDDEAALLAREHEIDIAVDLTGFTTHSRTGIFATRAAPIQVNYLGYPGTMGADYFDYMIADPIVISDKQRVFYTEKIARLPHAYQANDTKRKISEEPVSRAQHDLPEKAFVFCSFNNNYKITPQVFDDWMAILRRLEGSVLWLLEDNAEAAQNLRREAEARGMSQSRIIFAQRTSLPRHLARHRLADLFLDTLPYNAHTTASDALWTGLPVLTLQGEAFAGRVAASLLQAIGLPELITTTREDYRALAIELATYPDKLARIKNKLAANRLTTPLFDIDRFTADIETLYTKMYDRHQRDLPPADIDTRSP